MKTNLFRMLRSGVALLLVFCMVVGFVPTTVFATGGDAKKETLNYVSLGDSMTNGYGLTGYDHNSGVEDYGTKAYPNQFVTELEKQGYAVDHAQLAMSGIRTEDIHWLLEFDYEGDGFNVLKSMIAGGENGDTQIWDPVAWNNAFGAGDYWTLDEIANHGRTTWAAKDIVATGYNDFPSTYGDGSKRYQQTALIAKYYQEKVAAADVISLSVGNGNIGVFGFGRILEIIGFNKRDTYMKYDVADVLRECDSDMQNKLNALIKEMYTLLEAKTGMAYNPETAQGKLMDMVVYIGVSLAMNYAGTVDAILQMNPDVEIILVPVMNTFANETKQPGFTGISIGDLMGYVVTPINKFIAALPTYMQTTNHEVYMDAKFYYAEPGSIECMVDTYPEDIAKKDNVIRDRFVEDIVGTTAEPGMIWGLMADKVSALVPGAQLVAITRDDVEAYEKMEASEKAAYAAGEKRNTAISCALYLSFEDAIIKAGGSTAVSLESVLGLSELMQSAEGLFGNVLADFSQNIEADAIKHMDDACAAAAVLLEQGLEMEGATFTADDIKLILAGQAQTVANNTITNIAKLYVPTVKEEAEKTVNNGLAAMFDGINNSAAGQGLTVDFNANGYLGKFSEESGVDTVVEAILKDSQNQWTVMLTYLRAQLEEITDRVFENCKSTLENLVEGATIATDDAAALETAREMVVTELSNILGIEEPSEEAVITLIAGKLNENVQEDSIEMICMLLAVPDTLSASLVSDAQVAGLLSLFARCMIGNGLGGHPSATGHDELARAVIAAYGKHTAEDETIKNLTELAKIASGLVAEYYDEAYAYAYAEAKNAGYIDEAVAGIDSVIAALNALDLDAAGMTDELKAETAAEIKEIIDTLNAAKALLVEADVLDQASLDALLVTLKEAADAAEQLLDVLKQAGTDVNDLVIVPALTKAYNKLVNEVLPAINANLKEAVKAGTEYLLKKLGETYNDLVDALVAFIAEKAPKAADWIYNWLMDNADKVLNWLHEYDDNVVDFITEHAKAFGAVIVHLINTYGEDVAEFVMNNANEILATMVQWFEENGEKAWELIKTYLAELGVEIEGVVEDIKTILNKINDAAEEIQKNVVDTYNKLIDEINKELDALIDLIENELKTATGEAKAALENLLEAAKQLQAALAEMVKGNIYEAIAKVQEAYSDLVEALQNGAEYLSDAVYEQMLSLVDTIRENVCELVKGFNECAKKILGETYDKLVDLITETIREQASEAADWIYNWLYNNPDKVIAWITEYGDNVLEFVSEHAEAIVAVIGYLVHTFGEEIAEFVMNNANEILATMVQWFEEHGENAWELILVYLEELGVLDAIEDVTNNLTEELNKLKQMVGSILPALKGQGEAYLNALLEQVEALIEAVKEQMKTADEMVKAQLEAVLKAAEDLKAAIEKAIKDGVAAAIDQLKAAVAALDKAIQDAAKALNDHVIDKFNQILNTVKQLLDFTEELEEVLGYVNQLLDLIKEELAKLEGEAKAKLEALYNKVEALKQLVEQMIIDGSNAAMDKLMEAVAEVVMAAKEAAEYLTEQAAAQMEIVIDKIMAILKDLYDGATHEYYYVNEDSYYVAIGDGTAVSQSYVDKLAAELGIGYKNLAVEGMMVADTYDLLKTEKAEIEKADLITIGFGSNSFMDYAIDRAVQLELANRGTGEAPETLDWSVYVGEKGAANVEAALTDIYNDFVEQGLGVVTLTYDTVIMGTVITISTEIDIAKLMTVIVESYAYAVTSYACDLPEVINEIHAINPDAQVILVGMYNPVEGVAINLGESTFEIGEYVDYLVTGANVHNFAYALMTDNAIFVEAADVESVSEAAGADTTVDVLNFLMMYINADIGAIMNGDIDTVMAPCGEATNPSGVGHEYIKQQILGSLILVQPVEIEFSRMILGNELAMQFAFKQAPIMENVEYAVSVTKTYADGRGDKTIVIPENQWKSTEVNGEPYYYVSFNGIAAKEMGDEICVQVIALGNKAVSEVFTDSVESYAIRQLRKSEVAVVRTLYVDMLNYGAAAQTYFKYDAEDLVNAELTETEQGYATESVELENKLVAGTNYSASQLNLASSIQLRLRFNNIDSTMYAMVSFTNHTGREIEVKVDGSEFLYDGTVVVVDEVVAADYEQDVTCTVYDAEGNTVASAVDSVASYIARMSGENAPAIYDAVAKYTTAAYAYLHK